VSSEITLGPCRIAEDGPPPYRPILFPASAASVRVSRREGRRGRTVVEPAADLAPLISQRVLTHHGAYAAGTRRAKSPAT
jgi:hypothetical protein